MKKILTLYIFLCVIFNLNSFAQGNFLEITQIQSSGYLNTNSDNKLNSNLSNISQYKLQIDSVVLASNPLDLSISYNFTPVVIMPKEVFSFEINFNSKENIDYKVEFYVYYRVLDLKQNLTSMLEANLQFKYGDIYDDFTQNKSDLVLKSALGDYLSSHTSYTYKQAREYMFGSFDNVDGYVECVYTGEKLKTDGIPDVNTTHFNNEHTWPQSKGADYEPPKSDIYHMYPTNETANAQRGDYPFGYVVSNVTWEKGGSKLGKDKNGNICFEPRDVHKGNVARSLFYFATAYKNPFNWLNPQEETLRQWMDVDPVDEREMKRNNDIANVQGKRNPFIDHPEFLHRIYSISQDISFPQSFKYSISESEVSLSTLYLEKYSNYTFYFTNKDLYNTSIESASFNNPSNDPIIKSVSEINNVIIGKDNAYAINIEVYDNPASEHQQSILTLNCANGNKIEIPFNEVYYNSVSEINNNIQIQPNPTNNFIKISNYSGNIIITDIFGRIVLSYKNYYQEQINISNFVKGVYFVRLDNQIQPLKLIKD